MSSRVSPWFLALVASPAGGVLAAVGDHPAGAHDGHRAARARRVGGVAVPARVRPRLSAYRGGDRSVRAKGYLTLDIRRYADLGLSLVLPVFFLLLGGIPLPGGAVWIDHGAIRSRAVRSLVSLAGPAANLVIGAVLAAAVAFVPMPTGSRSASPRWR